MKKNILTLCCLLTILSSYAQIGWKNSSRNSNRTFVHPGMAQSRGDLDYMKEMIQQAKEPWHTAYQQLKKETSLAFKPNPHTHVSVGAYNTNSTGGKEFAESSEAAYYHALLWYITSDKRHAEKAIEILKAWSEVLWDFDDNNAKLNVGLDGPGFLYAAEILKHSYTDWKKADYDQFERMVLTVFYPVIKDFFTEANGNWDASMIHTMLCIGVLTDNEEIFNRAIQRFLHGPGNGGITKYIYPNGQIQETTRDWDHVQLGIGEFAKAAQVAWTQGVDLYSVANDRLASGYEYTSRFLLGDSIPVYGILSTRQREKFRDIYESIYDYYQGKRGVSMPYTEKMIKRHTRRNASISVLTGIRRPEKQLNTRDKRSLPMDIPAVVSLTGAKEFSTAKFPPESVYVKPGVSLQKVIDQYAKTGKWVVLSKGVYELDAPLKIPSGTVLAGQGRETILFLSSNLQSKTLVNASKDLHEVVIRDLLIEGASTVKTNPDPNSERRTRSYMSAPSREGISFQADSLGQMQHIKIEHVTVQNFTKNGVSIRGANDVYITDCDLSDNGGSVVPGHGFHHNLHLTRVEGGQVINNRLDTSPWGNGIDLSFVKNLVVANNEAARNKLSGIRCVESENVEIAGNLLEGNDLDGLCLETWWSANRNIIVRSNVLQYNGRNGIFVEKISENPFVHNVEHDNGYTIDLMQEHN